MTVELFEMSVSPPCRAIKVLAKLIGLDLKITPIDMMGKQNLEPEFLKINPFHTIPAINDDGFHLYESRAILVYLVKKYAPDSDLYPKDLQERALVDAFLSFDNGTLADIYLNRLQKLLYFGQDAAEVVLEKCKDNLKCLDNVLATRKYTAGDHLTLADISIGHTLSIADGMEDDISEFVHVSEYKERLRKDLGTLYTESTDDAVQKFRGYLKSKRAT